MKMVQVKSTSVELTREQQMLERRTGEADSYARRCELWHNKNRQGLSCKDGSDQWQGDTRLPRLTILPVSSGTRFLKNNKRQILEAWLIRSRQIRFVKIKLFNRYQPQHLKKDKK